MFTASQYEFRSSPDVRRNFPLPTLRTEEAPTRWLLGKQSKDLFFFFHCCGCLKLPSQHHPTSFSFQGDRLLIALFVFFCCVCTEADFVGSVLLKESINSSIGDDDKVYFFFTERSQEQAAYPSQTKVSRIARVCKVGQTRHCSVELQKRKHGIFTSVKVCLRHCCQANFESNGTNRLPLFTAISPPSTPPPPCFFPLTSFHL